MEHSIDSRTTQLSAVEQCKLHERRAGFLFFAIYLVCATVFCVALVIATQFWTVNAYVWGFFGVVLGPIAPASAAAVVYYAWTTWYLVVETTSSH